MSENQDMPELVLRDADERAIGDLLQSLQRAVLAHPEATRALFSALEREGRLFAQTAMGNKWRERIAQSKLLERALLVWQGATLWTEEEPEHGLPSTVVTAIAAASASPEREALLATLFPGSSERG